jgi:predicted  nucleic acid-binding Zn-ribbon protein
MLTIRECLSQAENAIVAAETSRDISCLGEAWQLLSAAQKTLNHVQEAAEEAEKNAPGSSAEKLKAINDLREQWFALKKRVEAVNQQISQKDSFHPEALDYQKILIREE